MSSVILIALAVVLATIGAARRKGGGRRRMGRYLRGSVDESLTLGTLAATTLVSAAFDEVVTEESRLTSIVGTWAMADMTAAAGAGPIMVGYAHSDYTDAEIEEVIENTGSWDIGNLVQQETAKRLVRRVGLFQTSPAGAATGIQTLNDGKPIKTKLNWNLKTGATVRVWAYNTGSAALAGTSPVVRLQGHANLFPR